MPAPHPETDAARMTLSREPLFPPIEPYRMDRLAVGDGHQIYFEECGRRDGAPVVFLHGGPGAGASPMHRRFFDPQHYRIVVFDQRGAGRSTPFAGIQANDPGALVRDMEALRLHLGIERWHVFGGSWGSTLAMLYAQSHPERCLSLVLRGIFLMTRAEVDWFLGGMGRFFPEAHERFVRPIPAAERGDLLGAYYRRLIDPDPSVHVPAAAAWASYEAACSTLLPNPRAVASNAEAHQSLALSRIEAHFFANHLFEPENRLLRDLDRLSTIPAVIVQGRYDVVCPPRTAITLGAAWPQAQLTIVPDAGHSAMEPGIRAALVEATQRFRRIPAAV